VVAQLILIGICFLDAPRFSDLQGWGEIASYAGTNIVMTPQAVEVSRAGSPNEVVTVRDAFGISSENQRFLRVRVTRP